MKSLVFSEFDLDFLNEFQNMNNSRDLMLFILNLKDYTLKYIKGMVDFANRNWLVKRINDYMIYSGKMVRSSFFYIFLLGMVCDLKRYWDQNFWDKVFKLGAIFELAHSATLVHDDILDGAKKRRGKPAVHIKFGIDGALIFGDILIISVLNKSYEVDPLYSKLLMEALENMCFGEVLQYQNKYNVYLEDEEYFEILYLKTGVLFAAISVIAYHLGCRYTNTSFDNDTARVIYDLFSKYGVAFQIVDDVLDYFQDEKILKKDSNNDLLSGRITYPLILLMKDFKNKSRFKNLWLKNPSYFSKVVTTEIRKRKDLLENSIKKSEEFLDLKYLDVISEKIGMKDIFRDSLRFFVNSLVYRNY